MWSFAPASCPKMLPVWCTCGSLSFHLEIDFFLLVMTDRLRDDTQRQAVRTAVLLRQASLFLTQLARGCRCSAWRRRSCTPGSMWRRRTWPRGASSSMRRCCGAAPCTIGSDRISHQACALLCRIWVTSKDLSAALGYACSILAGRLGCRYCAQQCHAVSKFDHM